MCVPVPSKDLDFQSYIVVFFLVCSVRGDYSFCWYWWNCGPSCFKLSFHIFDSCINSCLAGRINKVFSKCFLEEILYIMRVQFPEYNDMKTEKEVNEFEFVIFFSFFLQHINTWCHYLIKSSTKLFLYLIMHK